MPYFVKSGNTFKVHTKEDLDIYESLPVGTYTVGHGCGGFFLQTIEPFQIKGKIYGETPSQSDRILRTFMDRTPSTGVLLAGEKGSGKTLLAKYISIQAAKEGVPTVVINKNWHGEEFNIFLQTITQPLIILFDEYEKVYASNAEQEKMLTLLDGVHPSKKLFLLTCNDKWRVNANMRNRPGRIFYLIDFTGISQAFVAEYCQDNLVRKEHIGKICAIARLFCAFNFDMLKALVEEMNRYNEAPSESLKFLNTRPEFSNKQVYSVTLIVKGKQITKECGLQSEWSGNPLLSQVGLSYLDMPYTSNSARKHPKYIVFEPTDLIQLNADSGEFVFEKEDIKMILKEKVAGYNVDIDKITSSSAKGAVTKKAKIGEEEVDIAMLVEEKAEY